LGKKGKTARLKRKPAPAFWPIHRKDLPWVTKPASGSHSLEKCLPLTVVLRDMLGVAQTRKEGQLILNQGKVLVNGKVYRKDDIPVGLMDVIAMPESGTYYRVMPSHKGLYLAPISKDESNFSLLRVENKSTVHNGVQIALHDGSIILVKVADPKKPIEVTYETFDVLKLTYPDKTVTQVLKTKEGNIAVITGGKNVGKMGKIVEIEKTEAKKRRQALVVIEDATGTRYQTILDFIFSIGETAPLVNSLEASASV
jgi:small subunit ribosomal protein S4e